MVRARRSSKKPSGSSKRIKRTVNRLETGVKFTPSVDPPEYAAAPWWPMTIVDKITAEKQYKFSDIATGLLKMMGMTDIQIKSLTTGFFEIRVQTVRVWGTAKQAIALRPAEILGAGTHRIRQLVDLGSGINFSRLGWRYGAVSRIDPNKNEDTYICHVGGEISADKPVLVYFQVMFAVAAAPQPKEGDVYQSLPQGIEELELNEF